MVGKVMAERGREVSPRPRVNTIAQYNHRTCSWGQLLISKLIRLFVLCLGLFFRKFEKPLLIDFRFGINQLPSFSYNYIKIILFSTPFRFYFKTTCWSKERPQIRIWMSQLSTTAPCVNAYRLDCRSTRRTVTVAVTVLRLADPKLSCRNGGVNVTRVAR